MKINIFMTLTGNTGIIDGFVYFFLQTGDNMVSWSWSFIIIVNCYIIPLVAFKTELNIWKQINILEDFYIVLIFIFYNLFSSSERFVFCSRAFLLLLCYPDKI